MSVRDNLQARLREKANEMLVRFLPTARSELLIRCWMSHDARWFAAVAQECGMPVANRLNQIAAHEIGKVEAQRIVRASQMPPIKTLDDYLLAQELFIAFLGPDLLDYAVFRASDHAYQIHVRRCFAYDNAVRAGIAKQYACGIFARVTGWFDALGLAHAMNPSLGKCLKGQGQACSYTITLEVKE